MTKSSCTHWCYWAGLQMEAHPCQVLDLGVLLGWFWKQGGSVLLGGFTVVGCCWTSAVARVCYWAG